MINRRDVETATAQRNAEAQAMSAGLKAIEGRINVMKATMEQCLLGIPTPASGLALIDFRISEHTRSTGRPPQYCDVGLAVFDDVYDWHVRQQQPVRISRLAEQRIAIQYKFTQLVVRWEIPDPNFVGIPFNA